MGKVTPKAKATQERIASAAERLFSEKGFAGTSLQDIADEAGVSKGLIRHHFGAKDDLWRAVQLSQFQQFAMSQLQGVTDSASSDEYVRNGVERYFEFMRQNPRYLRLIWWNQAEHGASFLPEKEAMMVTLTQQIITMAIARVKEFQEAGDIRDDLDPGLVFAAYLGMVRHWFVASRDYDFTSEGESDDDLNRRYMDTAVDILLHGIKGR